MTDTLSILKEVLKNKGRMPKTGVWATLFEEFNRVGGTTGYRDLFLDAESRSKSLLSELQALDRGKVSQAAHAVVNWLSDYNEAMENATRLAAYKAAIDNGMSKERAASLAKNLTVNFNRKGTADARAGRAVRLLQCSGSGYDAHGADVGWAGGTKDHGRRGDARRDECAAWDCRDGRGDGEDDEWEKIPEFIKERSVIIPTGKDSYLSIPCRSASSSCRTSGAWRSRWRSLRTRRPESKWWPCSRFWPIRSTRWAGRRLQCRLLRPPSSIRSWRWRRTRTGPANRYSSRTATASIRSQDCSGQRIRPRPGPKVVAEAINAITGGTKYTPGGWSPTPDQIDFVIGQLTGGIGREAGKVAATATAPFTGEELPPYKIPLVGRLYGSTASHSDSLRSSTRTSRRPTRWRMRSKDG